MNGFSTLMWWLLWLIGRLPLPLLYSFGSLYGRAQLLLNTKICRVARINLERCFCERTAEQLRIMLRNFLIERGRELAITPAVLTRQVDSLRRMITSVEGGVALCEAMAAGPVVLLNAHIGALLLGGCMREFSATWFSQQQKGLFEPILDRRRNSLAIRGYVYTDTTGVRKALGELKNGGCVGVFCDQDPDRRSGRVLASFFGAPAYTSTLPVKLIQAGGARAFFYLCIRHPDATHYSLHIIPVNQQVEQRDRQPDNTAAAQALNDQLEAIIRRHPNHFDWSYERFRRANKGMYKPAKKRACH